jgi:hypothetical protein
VSGKIVSFGVLMSPGVICLPSIGNGKVQISLRNLRTKFSGRMLNASMELRRNKKK